MNRTSGEVQQLRLAYLHLLKMALTRAQFPELYRAVVADSPRLKRTVNHFLQKGLYRYGLELVHPVTVDASVRARGGHWPVDAETMIGLARLDNIEHCVRTVLDEDIPGDLVETGVWRGGATIFMRAVLKAYGVTDRTVWAADSFEGLPRPDPDRYPADAGSQLFANRFLAVSLEEVQRNFARYGLLDNQVRFLKGWFRDTLPTAPIEQISVLRLDGDLYESTMDALTWLYPKVQLGGFAIIDDFHSNETCRLAVEHYRTAAGVNEPMIDIDQDALYWRKDHL